jgi:DNA-binding Lrp family transcriptional regulator
LDRNLLALLQENARTSAADLARATGVARTTVIARVARMEREGIIAGYTVRMGHDVADLGLQAFIGITVQPKAGRDVVRQLARMPEVRQLCAVSGEFDYVVLLRAESALRMNTLLDEMGNFEGVVKTTTSVALEWKIDRT